MQFHRRAIGNGVQANSILLLGHLIVVEMHQAVVLGHCAHFDDLLFHVGKMLLKDSGVALENLRECCELHGFVVDETVLFLEEGE
jgi:hypothetical protein